MRERERERGRERPNHRIDSVKEGDKSKGKREKV